MNLGCIEGILLGALMMKGVDHARQRSDEAEALFLTIAVFLAWWSYIGVLEIDLAFTNVCYIAGIAISIWILRRNDIQELLKDDESSLDMYARQAGFIKEWRRKSCRRLMEAISCLILLCCSRCIVYMQLPVSTHDLVLTSAFCLASVGLVAIAYLQLHIFSGLELAIDSFSVNFFRDMNFQHALAEWNVLQAMLRHVSTKLSGSLLVLGLSSGISILYMIEVSFVRSDVQGGFPFLLSNLWSLPPIMFFLYTMMRAAAVTEKASRVSPLINSWTFVGDDDIDFENDFENGAEKDLEDEKEHEWMDLERQYMVQYINQSQAGFYIQGLRIRFFQVTKMSYYLGAVLFAVASRMAM